MSSINVREFIDLKQYPVDSPNSPEYARLVSDARAEMADDGCAVKVTAFRGTSTLTTTP